MSDILAGRAATFSKGNEFFGVGFQPSQIAEGYGAHEHAVYPDYGYLSWISALGANLLGYPGLERLVDSPANHWARRVSDQVWRGCGFSLPHTLEANVAERLVALLGQHVPGWQGQPLGLRWGKTGSDACSAAVRLARAVTGRDRIVSVGYHGFHDAFVSTSFPAWGVTHPQWVTSVAFGDLAGLLAQLDFSAMRVTWTSEEDAIRMRVAAVIIEQPPQPFPEGYWQEVRRLCDEHGALLIADEVVSGLRYDLGGAAERFGIAPDIICMGKGLGNGLPISCMVGRREYFNWFSRNDPVFVSSTHFGEAVGLAAADAVLDCWNQAAVDHLWQIGTALMDGLRGAGFQTTGYPPVFLTQHESPSHRAYFIRGMAQRGILANRPWIANLAHSDEDVLQTIEAAREVKAEMDRLGPDGVEAEMRGRLPQVLFANR